MRYGKSSLQTWILSCDRILSFNVWIISTEIRNCFNSFELINLMNTFHRLNQHETMVRLFICLTPGMSWFNKGCSPVLNGFLLPL